MGKKTILIQIPINPEGKPIITDVQLDRQYIVIL